MNDKLRLGWIGTGVMGHAMAGHLLASGYPLTVYNRTKSRAEGLLACGARWADTPQEVARNSDVVFSIVGYPRDVEEVMLGEQGALSGLAEGGILCDMTTSSPELARRIAEAAAAKGCISLDAPVTGGDIGAREARLSIFVGGDKEAFERVRPCFEVMGKTILHCGDSGSGQKAKLANQVAISLVMFSVCESMLFAQEAGLDVKQWLELVVPGGAGSVAMGPWAAACWDVTTPPVSSWTISSRTWVSAWRNASAWAWYCPALRCPNRSTAWPRPRATARTGRRSCCRCLPSSPANSGGPTPRRLQRICGGRPAFPCFRFSP